MFQSILNFLIIIWTKYEKKQSDILLFINKNKGLKKCPKNCKRGAHSQFFDR